MGNTIKGIATLQAASGSYNGGLKRENKTVATADATTTVIWASPVVAVGEAITVRGMLVGKRTDGTAGTQAIFDAAARRQSAGNVTLVGAATVTIKESNASTNVTLTANTTNQTLDLSVVGIAAESWVWEVHSEYIKV